jgi:hypothetical protein
VSQVVDITTREGLVEVEVATCALLRMNDLLNGFQADGRDVAVFRRQYPGWWRGTLSMAVGWNQDMHPDHVVTQEVLDTIETFAHYLDGKVRVVASIPSEGLRDILDKARTALEDDVSLSPRLAGYIHRLLQQIQNALDNQAMGEAFDFAGAIDQLYAALSAAEGESRAASEPESRTPSLWSQVLTLLVTRFSGDGAGALGRAAVDETMKAITGG